VPKVNRVACGDDVASLVPPSARDFGSGCRENRAARNENDIRHLTPIGGEFKCMRPVAPKRPVVLIVEDEFLLRMDAVGMIADAGFEVVEAANADDAIEILEARRDISVVFTDIQMPGSMDGLKLARSGAAGRRSRSSRPQALWMSGKRICRKADGFCRNPTRPKRSPACCWS
jgi:hypothetical protein